MPYGYEAHIVPRSSTFKTWGVIMTNSTGIVDNTYCGDNDVWRFPCLAHKFTTIHKNDRICQFRLMPIQAPLHFEVVESLGNEDRGGLGSSGIN